MSYQKLSVKEFGRQLLLTGDLDPIYIALGRLSHNGQLKLDRMSRWLTAYWCFYNAGFACWAAEQPDFWSVMKEAAVNETRSPLGGRWPRGSERRHFRGQQSIRAVKELEEKYPQPEKFLLYVSRDMSGGQFTQIAERVREHRGFGPWMAFKVADMLERVMGVPVDFTEAAVFMFDDPTKSALLLYQQAHPEVTMVGEAAAVRWAVNHLQLMFAGYKAAPNYDRLIGLQEIETILCKYKSHLNNHYPLLKDTHEIREGLAEWAPHSLLAQAVLTSMVDGSIMKEANETN